MTVTAVNDVNQVKPKVKLRRIVVALLLIATACCGAAPGASEDTPLRASANGRRTLAAGNNLEDAMSSLTLYRIGDDPWPVRVVESWVGTASGSPDARLIVISRLTEVLTTHSTIDSKRFVCEQLGLIGEGPEAKLLAGLLNTPELAAAAREALTRIPGPEASDAMCKALEVARGDDRIGLVNALGVRGDTMAVPTIGALLTDANTTLSAAAAAALARIGGPASFKALRDATAGGSEAAAVPFIDCAAQILKEFGDSTSVTTAVDSGARADAVATLESLIVPGHPSAVRRGAFLALLRAQPSAAPAMVDKALDGNDAVLHTATVEFLRTDGNTAILKQVVEKHLPRQEPAMQVALLSALEARGDSTVADAAAALLTTTHSAVRRATLHALGAVGSARHVRQLAGHLDASEKEIRDTARQSLLKLKGDDVDPALAEQLRTAKTAVKAELIATLAERGAAVASPVLLELVTTGEPEVSRAAVDAIGKLGDPEMLAPLLRAYAARSEEGDPQRLKNALLNLARRIGDSGQAVTRLKNEAIPLPVPLQSTVLDVIGNLKSRAALAELRSRVSETDPAMRLIAIRALADWPNARPIEDLLRAARHEGDSTASVLALRGIGRLAGLDGGPPKDRRAAIVQEAFSLAKTAEEKGMLESALDSLAEPTGPNLALGAVASSPDELEKDGVAGGDQAGNDGNVSTYWDETDGKPLYRYVLTFPNPVEVGILRIIPWQKESHAPRDFAVLSDGRVVREIRNSSSIHKDGSLQVVIAPQRCRELELKITGYHGGSPAIRELEVYGPSHSLATEPGKE